MMTAKSVAHQKQNVLTPDNWSVLGVMWCIIQGGLFTLWTHGFDYFNTCNCFYL